MNFRTQPALFLVPVLLLVTSPAHAACQKTPDPPYEPNEMWCKNGPVWTVSGRTPLPLNKKLNVLWWFGNDFEPKAPAWYRPGDPARELKWYLRNPFQNAGNYVAGIKDLNYSVRWLEGPVGQTSMADLGSTGCIRTMRPCAISCPPPVGPW